MSQQEQRVLEMRKQIYMDRWLTDWYAQAVNHSGSIKPADWIAIGLTMIDMMIDAQGLDKNDREKVAFGLMKEVHQKLSTTENDIAH